MSEQIWTSVEQYVTQTFLQDDPAFAVEAAHTAGLPPISVSAPQGKLLQLLAQSIRAKSILEIGTLAAYSTIYLARALPKDGKLITLECDATHAQIARQNIARAKLQHLVELRLAPAIETLPILLAEKHSFDFIFIDADKTGYPAYLEWSLKLAHPGTMILADNTVRKGAVADPTSADPAVQAVRQYNALVSENPRLTSTSLQTVSPKGYDGFTLSLVIK